MTPFLSVLLTVLSSANGAAFDLPQDPSQRMDRLEQENASLRERLRALEAAVSPLSSANTPAQRSGDERVDALALENAELSRRIDILAEELEREQLGSLFGPAVPDRGRYGLGRSASKVYDVAESGLSIGGYGEFLYQDRAGDAGNDVSDFLRAIIYFGYKFDDHWIFNSEIEFEHTSTGEGGEVSLEFAYFDYLHKAELNFRAGLLLVPMGFINELHEPVSFLTAQRPQVERRIIPTTWRENGIGLFGDVGPVSYRTYVLNGLDATGFSSGGLRGGRQDGSRALTNDLAWVGRADWTVTNGFVIGASTYWGDSGQDQDVVGGAVPDTQTSIAEAHVEYRRGGFYTRGLYAQAELDDVDDLNATLGLAGAASVGEELRGGYIEVGYDVLAHFAPDSTQSLTPYIRYEDFDTQADVPSGFSSAASNDESLLTFGVNWKPIDRIVIKADYVDADEGIDQWNLLLGYIF